MKTVIQRCVGVSVVKTTRLIRVEVRGVVQGVGFRPFVYQLASRNHLTGWVRNTSGSVEIEVEGEERYLQVFISELKSKSPPMARLESIRLTVHPVIGYTDFEIKQSKSQQGKYQLISPDIATCGDCLNEIENPADSRYRYPFTNCTNCGPRFTIIEDIPYDRQQTTMRHFKMCPACQKEYNDNLNRRFHAQPNACPVCGPKLELVDCQSKLLDMGDSLTATAQLLRKGSILAVKGIGGFLLACDATNTQTIELLRKRKRRPAKPFAVMFGSIEEAKRYCFISPQEERLLLSPQSPIVLLRCRECSALSPLVAPGLRYQGVMLPYTPLHHTLLRETGIPMIMTSGNFSEEPIIKDNQEALQRLGDIADYFLLHNRDIHARYDDSVALVENGTTQLFRRSRGYAPNPIHLDFKSRQILACGAEEKNTFCLAKDEYAFLSQHIGDMENVETMDHFGHTIELYKRLFRITPNTIACDLHPDYLATKYAHRLASSSPGINLVRVQHHHAHIVSCMVDNKLKTPVIGIAFDGTGFGVDGNIWGGEFLLADYRQFCRMGHLEYLPLPGGSQAIKKPYRIAIGYLLSLLGKDSLEGNLSFLKQVQELEITTIIRQLERKINSPLTSSCGRLFDAVSALIGVRGEIEYEAQAAIDLEMIAYDDENETTSYPFSIAKREGLFMIKLQDLLAGIIHDLQIGTTKSEISVKFHNTIAQVINTGCQIISHKSGIFDTVLSGGVFQNRLLLRKTIGILESSGFRVYTHREVPCNDGGISLGQAVIANFIHK